MHQPLRRVRTLLTGNPFAPLASEGADEAGAAAEPAAAHPLAEPEELKAKAEAVVEQGTCGRCGWNTLQVHKAELIGVMKGEEELAWTSTWAITPHLAAETTTTAGTKNEVCARAGGRFPKI